MRFALGFLAGVGAAWAALAIWQRVPPLGPVDDIDSDDAPPRIDPDAFERAADANQLRYRSQHRAGLGALRQQPVTHRFEPRVRVEPPKPPKAAK